MVACVRRVVTRRAGARERGHSKIVVEALDAGDLDRLGVEQRLSARDRAAGFVAAGIAAAAIERVPRIVELEYDRVGQCAGTIIAGHDIVDAEVELLLAEVLRTAQRLARGQVPSLIVEHLRGEERILETDDRLALR